LNQNDHEAVLWAEAQKGNTVEDYQVYLDTFPQGRYIPFANARIKKLKETAQTLAEQQEQQAWESAKKVNTEDSYGEYLRSYPSGRFAALAVSRSSQSCKFPQSGDHAPGWVCDEALEGFGRVAVGIASNLSNKYPDKKLPMFQQALLNALYEIARDFQSELNAKIAPVIKQYREANGNDKEDADKVSTSVSKQITNVKVGNSITIAAMDKQYLKVIGEDKEQTVDQVHAAVRRLVMTAPCAYTMKSYVEATGTGANESVNEFSDEVGKQCAIGDVLKELSSAGLNVVDSIKNSDGEIFLLLGVKDGVTPNMRLE
jgi:hypothetical protein